MLTNSDTPTIKDIKDVFDSCIKKIGNKKIVYQLNGKVYTSKSSKNVNK
jgi:hypothetical protein